jgi:hypothetical protein
VGKHFDTKYMGYCPKYGKMPFPHSRQNPRKKQVFAYFRVTLLVFEVTPAGFCGGLGLLFV